MLIHDVSVHVVDVAMVQNHTSHDGTGSYINHQLLSSRSSFQWDALNESLPFSNRCLRSFRESQVCSCCSSRTHSKFHVSSHQHNQLRLRPSAAPHLTWCTSKHQQFAIAWSLPCSLGVWMVVLTARHHWLHDALQPVPCMMPCRM